MPSGRWPSQQHAQPEWTRFKCYYPKFHFSEQASGRNLVWLWSKVHYRWGPCGDTDNEVLLLISVMNGIISSARLLSNQRQRWTLFYPRFLCPDGLISVLLKASRHCYTTFLLLTIFSVLTLCALHSPAHFPPPRSDQTLNYYDLLHLVWQHLSLMHGLYRFFHHERDNSVNWVRWRNALQRLMLMEQRAGQSAAPAACSCTCCTCLRPTSDASCFTDWSWD